MTTFSWCNFYKIFAQRDNIRKIAHILKDMA